MAYIEEVPGSHYSHLEQPKPILQNSMSFWATVASIGWLVHSSFEQRQQALVLPCMFFPPAPCSSFPTLYFARSNCSFIIFAKKKVAGTAHHWEASNGHRCISWRLVPVITGMPTALACVLRSQAHCCVSTRGNPASLKKVSKLFPFSLQCCGSELCFQTPSETQGNII